MKLVSGKTLLALVIIGISTSVLLLTRRRRRT